MQFSKGFWQRALSPRQYLAALILFAGMLFLLKAAVSLSYPYFGGDAGHRMNNLDDLVVRLGNRRWLPGLQAQLRLLYELGAPAWAFRLVPPVHFFAAATGLGALCARLSGRSAGAAAFGLFLVASFALQRPMHFLSVRLYQEMFGAALLFWALAGGGMELSRRGWLILLAAAALLTRDTCWIYLLAVTAIHARQILSDPRLRWAFLLLWTIPAVWLGLPLVEFVIEQRRLPAIPIEWPLMINKQGNRAVSDLSASWSSLSAAFVSSRIGFLSGALLTAWLVIRTSPGRPAAPAPVAAFVASFARFSAVSLPAVYLAILLLNPWEATSGNTRMMTPLIEQCFVWAALLFGWSALLPRFRQTVARTVLVAGLALSAPPRPEAWEITRNPAAHRVQEKVESILTEGSPDWQAMVCLAGEGYWELTRKLSGALRYEHFIHLEEPARLPPGTCDFLITPAGSGVEAPPGLNATDAFSIDGVDYTLYRSAKTSRTPRPREP